MDWYKYVHEFDTGPDTILRQMSEEEAARLGAVRVTAVSLTSRLHRFLGEILVGVVDEVVPFPAIEPEGELEAAAAAEEGMTAFIPRGRR